MTAFFVDPGQRATGLNRRSIQSSAIPSTESDSARLPEATTAREIAFVDRDAFCARPPLTAKGIAAYAGVMTTFTGTSGNDAANASTGTLNGFSDGTVTELQDATGDKFVGDAGNDTIVAGSGNDTIDGNSGDDTLYGGAGDDTINLANSDFGFTELIDGGAGSDRIVLTNATTVDFSIGTVSGVETFTGSSGDDIVTVTAEQWAGSDTIDLGEGTDVLNVKVDGLVDIWALSIPASIGGVETGNLSGSSDDDVLMLTGAQLDAIIIGNGTIDLGGGNQDTIMLASTSADLNTLGATDASISYVEAIDAYMATAGVTINLSGQSESVRIYGGAGNDTITGGTGGDFVWDGEGVDTIVCGAGDDWFSLMEFGFVAGEMIIGGDDSGSGYRDGIMLVTACPSIDFSTCTVSGFETLIDMAGYDNAVTMTVEQWTQFAVAIDLTVGTDVLDVKVSGTMDISTAGVPASVDNVETVKLVGTAGDDKLTLTGAQLDAILSGTASNSIDFGKGFDTIILTGDSAVFDRVANGSIENVELISATGVTANLVIDLSGQAEGLKITGGKGNDTITGGAGADTITGGSGADRIAGGAGDDTITGGTGVSGSRLYGGTGDDKITGGNGADRISGGAGADKITGGNGADRIDGGAGDADTINGGAGDDTVSGGAGADMLSGGAGNDVYVVDNTGDKVIESVSGGLDGIQSSITFSLVSVGTVETLTLTGSGSIKGTGNAYNNKLTGNTGANTLDGGAGNDMLNGGVGKDMLTGGAGKDTFFFTAALSAANSDKINDFSVADDTVRMENAVFAALKATGTLAESAFYAGAAAHDASDRIIYNKATGALSYDADGKGGTAAVQFATLGSGLALTHADFMVV